MDNSLLMVISEAVIWAGSVVLAGTMAYYLIKRSMLGLSNPTNQLFLFKHIFALGLATFAGGFVFWWATLLAGDGGSAKTLVSHSAKWTVVAAIAILIGVTGIVRNTFVGMLGSKWWAGFALLYSAIILLIFALIEYGPLIIAYLAHREAVGVTILSVMAMLWTVEALFVYWLYKQG